MKQDLFARLNLPYYIHCPAYADDSDEARVLHHLCHALNLAGEEAYVTEEGSGALHTPQLTQERIDAHLRAGRSPVVVYPDGIDGNPLNADHVVRYLLAPAGSGKAAPAASGEMTVAWRQGTAPANVPVLATPLADDERHATSKALFAQQLQQFIAATQHRFNPRFNPHIARAALAPAARIIPGRLAHPLGRPAIAAATSISRQLPPPVQNTVAPPPAAPVQSAAPLMPALKTTPLAQGRPPLPVATSAPANPPSQSDATAAMPGQSHPLLKTTPLTQGRALPQPARKKRLVVYSVESTWSPCPQIRLIRPFAHLQDEWELIWGIKNGQLQTDHLADADLIVLHRFTPGLMSIPTLQAIFASKVPIVYESDDLLNDIPHDHPEAQQGASWKEGIEYTVKHAKAVVVSTEFLAAKYRELNPAVHVLPNYIDFDLFHRPVPQDSATDGKINIGLLGSSIQPSNFALVDEALRALVERYGERLHIDFVGWECPKGWAGHPRATFHSFVHQYVDYAARLRQWNWDIALIPLASDEYNQCKSYIKWLDYSAAGIASVFSDVSVYNEVVTHGQTGLLIPNSGREWLEAITTLIEHPEQRRALAEAAQQAVREGFDLHRKAPLYGQTYGQLASTAQSGMAHP
jgi:glycosyltransferase involved in cell wall biosynthesis